MGYHFTVASIAPLIGTILTIVRSVIPLRDVLTVRKEHQLGVSERVAQFKTAVVRSSLQTIANACCRNSTQRLSPL